MSVSRYSKLPTAIWTAPDGRQVPYLTRRLLPAAGTMPIASVRTVRLGERVDTIAAATLNDPTLSWMLADANLAMRPTKLPVPGTAIQVPLPGGGASVA